MLVHGDQLREHRISGGKPSDLSLDVAGLVAGQHVLHGMLTAPGDQVLQGAGKHGLDTRHVVAAARQQIVFDLLFERGAGRIIGKRHRHGEWDNGAEQRNHCEA